MEVRYIVFTEDEERNAIVAFIIKQRLAATPNDVAEVELVSDNEDPSAMVQFRPPSATKPTRLNSQYLIAALLLYCLDRRIPITKRAQKKLELSIHGLTLVLTTDALQGSPRVADDNISYGVIANRATQEIGTVREELSRALARAEYAEGLIAQAEATARRVEAERCKSTAILIDIGRAPGLRGVLGRWLVGYRDPN
jgi:hypothetical protein